MKRLITASLLALLLSLNGIGETQTQSKFPRINKQNAINVEFSNCKDVIFSLTGYAKEDEPSYYVYEVGSITFAIIEFPVGSEKSSAIYVLGANKTVLKYIPSEFDKIESPCKTIEALKLINDYNKF